MKQMRLALFSKFINIQTYRGLLLIQQVIPLQCVQKFLAAIYLFLETMYLTSQPFDDLSVLFQLNLELWQSFCRIFFRHCPVVQVASVADRPKIFER